MEIYIYIYIYLTHPTKQTSPDCRGGGLKAMATRNQSWSNRGSWGTVMRVGCVSFNPPKIEMYRDILRCFKCFFFETASQIDAITDPQLHPKRTENPPLSLVVFVFFRICFSSDPSASGIRVDTLQLRSLWIVEVVYGESTEPGYGVTGYSDPL